MKRRNSWENNLHTSSYSFPMVRLIEFSVIVHALQKISLFISNAKSLLV